MKKKRIFTLDELKRLPIGFQFFTKSSKKIEDYPKPKLIGIDFYQTSRYQSSKFYKPISKILSQ